MAEISKTASAGDDESRVWEGIHLYESIVDAFPNDRAALDSLTHAYEQIGERTLAVKHLVRLAEVTMADGDDASLAAIEPRLKRMAESDDAAARGTLARVAAFLATSTHPESFSAALIKVSATVDKAGDDGMGRTAAVSAELSLAWNLHQAGELNAEDYAKVANDITELSGSDKLVTVSVLHVLHDRGERSLDRILALMSKENGTPVIPLNGFEMREEVAGLLPMEYMLRNGVLVFDLMGHKDAMVVILNPYRQPLCVNVSRQLSCNVHFYLTPPADFDAALDRIRKQRAEKAATPVSAPAHATPT